MLLALESIFLAIKKNYQIYFAYYLPSIFFQRSTFNTSESKYLRYVSYKEHTLGIIFNRDSQF